MGHHITPSLQPQVDLLHPLASLEWSERCEIPVSIDDAQAVVLGTKVYIGGAMYPGLSSRLLIYDFSKDSWDKLDTPTYLYALTTYHSQLVLVGGVDPDTKKATNQLWILDEQHHWTQPFPPMTTKRYQASAVSEDDHLIVAGGYSDAGALDEVVVYDGHQWRRVQPLPRACSWMKSAVLRGNWYLAGRMEQNNEQGYVIYHTSLDSLIASPEKAGQMSVWKKLPDAPLKWSAVAVSRNQLITVGGGDNYSSAIHAYSTTTNSWVHVGDLPDACYSPNSLVLPTGELVVVGTKFGLASFLLRANIRGELGLHIGTYHCKKNWRLI